MLPAAQVGARKAGRSLDSFRVCIKPLTASARTEEELIPKIRDARARIAFYASTPAYAAAFEHHGLGNLAREAAVLSKAQRWEELPRLISDETLDLFAVVGTYDQIGSKLTERFRRVVTDVVFSIAVRDDDDRARLRQIAADIQSDPETDARRAIFGG